MARACSPKASHEEHLCYLDNIGFVKKNLAAYKKLVAGGGFVCKACGRVAKNKKNLCVPAKI